MKTERYAPWLYISAAILVFILVIVVSASITSALDTSQANILWENLFRATNAHTIYLPLLSGGSQPAVIAINPEAGDNGLGIQDLDEGGSP